MAAEVHRLRLWWLRGGRAWAIRASGFGILLIALVLTVGSWVRQRTDGVGGDLVELTLVRNAEEKGAVCLDGSPPGYHIKKGFGSGSSNWVVHLEGGGWCSTPASCSARKSTPLGSSRYMEPVPFYGILSHNPSENPDFFNWNKVKVRYCDGASFFGDIESEDRNGMGLFFRGQRIWEAVMRELLSDGLTNAKQALLTGCSAGGLATFIHCDDFRTLLSKDATVKCLSDAGFFLDEKDISMKNTMRSFYHDVIYLQGIANRLSKDCILKMEPSQCFFPKQMIKSINTPVFVLNPTYDFWQIQNVLAPEGSDPSGSWLRCKQNIQKCDSKQLEVLQGFRIAMVNSLNDFRLKKDGGMFLNSCFIHCQTLSDITWHSSNSPRIVNKTIAEAVGDWYFDRRALEAIDCQYPCNPTCYNMNFG